MTADRQQPRMDVHTRLTLTVIAAMLALLAIGMWTALPGKASAQGPAQGSVPFADASAQRDSMIQQQQITNAKLEELIGLLKSGQVTVQLAPGEMPATYPSR